MDEARASVEAALEMLQEETAALVEAARAQGADAYACGDTKAFERLDGQRKQFEAFAEQLAELVGTWHEIGDRPADAAVQAAADPERTEPLSAEDYHLPILQILDEAGGTATVPEVREKIDPLLRPIDREKLLSGYERCQSRMQAARRHLRDAGLLSSPGTGTWEITDRGRDKLRSGDTDAALKRRRR